MNTITDKDIEEAFVTVKNGLSPGSTLDLLISLRANWVSKGHLSDKQIEVLLSLREAVEWARPAFDRKPDQPQEIKPRPYRGDITL